MKYLAAAVACSVAACGSSEHGPRTINLSVAAVPDVDMMYLQYRDGAGAWQQPASNGDGTYALVVTDEYEVIAAFQNPTDYPRYQVEELRATVDGPAPTIMSTLPSGYPAPAGKQPMFHVSGQTTTPTTIIVETPPDGAVSVADSSNGGFIAGAFATSDYLYALGSYQNGTLATVVRRSFDSGRDTSVGTIDVATEARALPTHPVMIANAMHSGLSQTYVEIEGPGRLPLRGSAPITGAVFDMPLLPESMRLPDDHYAVSVGTSGQNYRDSDAENLTTVELMSPVAVDLVQWPPAATWPIDDRDADLAARAGLVGHHLRATAGWLAAVGATSLTAREDPPGFDPRWRLDPTLGHVAISLTLSTSTPTSVNSVTMSN